MGRYHVTPLVTLEAARNLDFGSCEKQGDLRVLRPGAGMQGDGVGDIRRVCFCHHGQHCGSKSQGAEQDSQGHDGCTGDRGRVGIRCDGPLTPLGGKRTDAGL